MSMRAATNLDNIETSIGSWLQDCAGICRLRQPALFTGDPIDNDFCSVMGFSRKKPVRQS
jgi:hypothetical protein